MYTSTGRTLPNVKIPDSRLVALGKNNYSAVGGKFASWGGTFASRGGKFAPGPYFESRQIGK